MFTDKICYKVFHAEYQTENSKKRSILVENIKKQFENKIDELDTPTIKMFTVEDVKNFYIRNKSLRVLPQGISYRIGKRHESNPDNRGWKLGDLGIIANNYTAWINFFYSDYDYALLMEDDLVVNNNFLDLLEKYMKELPADWEVFSMFTKPEETIDYVPRIHDIKKENVCRSYNIASLAAYVINKRFVAKMMESMKEYLVQVPADLYVFNSGLYKAYNLKPGVDQACYLENLESTFQESYYYDFFEFFENIYNARH